MKELQKYIKSLLESGKSKEDIAGETFACEKYQEVTAEEFKDAFKAAKKAYDAEKALEEDAKTEAQKQAEDEKIKTAVEKAKAELKAELKTTSPEDLLETLKKDHRVSVKEDADAWKAETGRILQLAAKSDKTNKENEEYHDLKSKAVNRLQSVYGEKDTDAIIAQTDASGGFFMPPEFDPDVDKAVYKKSELLEKMQIRRGNEKTLINSIGTFDFTTRTSENTTATETKPTFAQEEVNPEQAIALVSLSNRALRGSAYNLISELTELAADAKIRYLEPLVTTASVDVDSDPFDGIRFQSGITTVNSINDANNNGSGIITSKDLTNMYLNAKSQTRNEDSACFVMDTRELMLLMEEEGDDGQYKEPVTIINGQFVHKKTGKRIVVSDNMYRSLNGVTDRSTGSDVPTLFGPMSRFRFYQVLGMRVATSEHIFFKEDAIGIRFTFDFMQGIPAQSQDSFVSLQGLRDNQLV